MLSPSEKTPPRVWLLLGDKLGDNRQVQVIADALGWPYLVKRLVFRRPYVQGKPYFKASLHHLEPACSDPLDPPWPDLILTIGRRPSMAALWVSRQSGADTKLVLLGRPKRYLDEFDLVIATAQYRLPDRPNVLHIELPLMRADEAAIAAAVATWEPRLAGLKKPLIAVLIGGPTKPFSFDTRVVAGLADKIGRLAEETGGTIYVTTSRRTPTTVVETLEARLPSKALLYHWDSEGTDNPYLGLLGLADCFVVTGDSISMMVEVARLGKPLAIFPLPCDPVCRLRKRLSAPLGVAAGISRDLTAIHELLVRRRLAVRLGDPFLPGGPKAPDELPRVMARIKTLLAAPNHFGVLTCQS